MNRLFEIVLVYADGGRHALLTREPLNVGTVFETDGIAWQVFAERADGGSGVIARFLCRPVGERHQVSG